MADRSNVNIIISTACQYDDKGDTISKVYYGINIYSRFGGLYSIYYMVRDIYRKFCLGYFSECFNYGSRGDFVQYICNDIGVDMSAILCGDDGGGFDCNATMIASQEYFRAATWKVDSDYPLYGVIDVTSLGDNDNDVCSPEDIKIGYISTEDGSVVSHMCSINDDDGIQDILVTLEKMIKERYPEAK